MVCIDATVVRDEWAESVLHEYGSFSGIAEKINVPPSTVARWFDPNKDATGRFIATVLNNFPVEFDEAFRTVRREVPDDRVRLRRVYR